MGDLDAIATWGYLSDADSDLDAVATLGYWYEEEAGMLPFQDLLTAGGTNNPAMTGGMRG